MGSQPAKAIQDEDQPKYYDLQDMAEEWAYYIDSKAGDAWQRSKARKDDYYLKFNYDSLKISEKEPVFEKDPASLVPKSDNNLQYTTVVGEREYINMSSTQQTSIFSAEGELETTFSAELTRALKVEHRSSVSFNFDTKRLPEEYRVGKAFQHRVNIEEMHDSKLQYETKDSLRWVASYPVKVDPYKRVTAQLLVSAKEECLEFIQPIKLEGKIVVTILHKGTNAFVRLVEGKVHAVVDYFIRKHGGVEGFVQVLNDDTGGFVEFQTKGKVRFSLGVKEVMSVQEQDL